MVGQTLGTKIKVCLFFFDGGSMLLVNLQWLNSTPSSFILIDVLDNDTVYKIHL